MHIVHASQAWYTLAPLSWETLAAWGQHNHPLHHCLLQCLGKVLQLLLSHNFISFVTYCQLVGKSTHPYDEVSM